MRTISIILLATIAFCTLVFAQAVLSPKQFTIEFIAELKKALPSAKILQAGDLELKVKDKKSSDHTVFLDNAYDSYKQDPAQKQGVIDRYIDSTIETLNYKATNIDKNRIVPILKDRPWLYEIKQSMAERGAKKLPDLVTDDYNSELIIIYAEDTPKNIKYITNDDFKKLNIKRKELKALAVQNLKSLLPKIELLGGEGLFLITAGGDYEASLLLFDSIWKSGQIKVQGDIVVAIPSRDLLIITGSQEYEGLSKAKKIIEEAYEEGAYRLTKSFFVFKEGKFIKMDK